MPLPELNLWKMLGSATGADQTNPSVMSQMATQAGPSIPPFLRAPSLPDIPTGPKNPMVIEPPPQRPPVTAMPTTQPIGTLPQEIQPAQPAFTQTNPLANPGAQLPTYQDAIANAKLPDNSRALRELQLGEKSFGEQQGAYKSEIDKLKEGLAKYASSDRGIDFTPLAALSDSWFGGNLTQAAKAGAPETAAQKLHNMQDMQSKIAQLQGEIPKTELDSLKNKLAQMGYMDERQLKLEIAKLNAAGKFATAGNAGARLGLQEKRLQYQTEKEARAAVNNDAMLKQYAPRLEGAAKIGELIHSARTGKVISNSALLGQLNAEIARLETGSQSPGLGASEKTELLDASAELGAIRDRVTGKPTDAVHPEVLDAADKLITELAGSYMKGIDSRMDLLRSGMSTDQMKIVDEKHGSLKKTYSPRFGGWRGMNEVLGPKAGDVEDGHEFIGGDPKDPDNWKAK